MENIRSKSWNLFDQFIFEVLRKTSDDSGFATKIGLKDL